MSYIIDVTFNVLKHGNVEQSENEIILLAQESSCEYYYSDYEFERNVCIQRNHCVVTVKFDKPIYLIQFLRKIKKLKHLHIESIYQDDSSFILYASTFYSTQLMDKNIANQYKINKRQKTYSADETMILNALNEN
jgi:hypothetical protein